MAKYLDEQFWRESLVKPNWYMLLKDDFKRLEDLAKQKEGQSDEKEVKNEAYALVEEALQNNRLPLASNGENLDSKRQPIDTIVIHHTKNKPGMTLSRLNAMQLLRLYGGFYAQPKDSRLKNPQSELVWSNHFYKNKQVFWGYHWFVRENGDAEQILKDKYIAWHAGNWNVNTRSIAICIDDDLRLKSPNEVVIAKIAKIIKRHNPHVAHENIIGHNQVNLTTECPGPSFKAKWRTQLLSLL